VPVGRMEGHATDSAPFSCDAYPNRARADEAAEMRQVVVEARVCDSLRAAINNDDRVFDVGVRIMVDWGDEPRAAFFVQDQVPVNPGGDIGLEVRKNLIAPEIAVLEVIAR